MKNIAEHIQKTKPYLLSAVMAELEPDMSLEDIIDVIVDRIIIEIDIIDNQ